MLITKDANSNIKFNTYYEIGEDIATNINMYRIGDRLGIGGNAAVYECIDSKGNEYAIKFLLNFGRKIEQRFNRETALLKQLSHPHIIKYIDMGTLSALNIKNKQSVTIHFIIMEKAEKTLVEFISEQSQKIDYEIYAPQFRGLSEALLYLHEYAIHRDIKPENILVKGEKWLISDFGLCSLLDSSEEQELTRDNERIGPKWWISPEAANKVYWGPDDIDKSSDVYQLSAVFWFVITRKCPIGIIEKDDFAEFDSVVCEKIIESLHYCKSKRPQNGKELFNSICAATINKEL